MTGCGKLTRKAYGNGKVDFFCGDPLMDHILCPSCAAKIQARVEELEKQLTMSETLSQSREENRVRALKAWQDAERRAVQLEERLEALARYARHLPTCSHLVPVSAFPCDCGLAEALK